MSQIKSETQIKSELGQLIDCTEEKFREFCKDKDLGYLSSFHNLMVQTFNEVQKIKDEVVQSLAVKSHAGVERTPEEQSTLEGLYSKLMRIEQRVFILREFIEARHIPLEVPSSGT